MSKDYRADDRPENKDDPTASQGITPETRYAGVREANPDLLALIALWDDRDMQYAQSSRPLSEAQIETIRAFRMREANDLPPKQRGRAGMMILSWYPPAHGQGAL